MENLSVIIQVSFQVNFKVDSFSFFSPPTPSKISHSDFLFLEHRFYYFFLTVLDLQKNCKDITERFHIFLTQFLLLTPLISVGHWLQFVNQC